MDKNGTRIQKVLSDNGILSRRKAEEYVKAGRITVNGRPAKLGHPINPARDLLAIDGVKVSLQKKKQNYYIMLNKPRGFVTTLSDELGRRCVAELVSDTPVKVFPVGRLDKDSEGLLLLTNDGDFANAIMHPRNHISKTYRVTVRPDVSEDQLVKLATGVEIDGEETLPAQVHVLEKVPGRVVLQMTIYEGRNRQIRKMCESVGLEVARLKRASIGPVRLGMLAPGAYRELKPIEVNGLRNALIHTPDGPGELAQAAPERTARGRGAYEATHSHSGEKRDGRAPRQYTPKEEAAAAAGVRRVRTGGGPASHSGSTSKPKAKGEGYQGSKPRGEGYQGSKPKSEGYQGSKPKGEGYQGSKPRGEGYQGSKPKSEGYQGSKPKGEGYQGSKPKGEGYQGSKPKGEGYQGSKPKGEGYQGSKPRGEGYQGSKPKGEGYQGSKPKGEGYQGSKPKGEGYQGSKPKGEKKW